VDGSGSLTVAREPVVNAWARPDPYADLIIPSSLPSPCPSGNWNNTQTINLGCYRGMDFRSHANVTLNPGVYYVDGDEFRANAQARIRCNCTGENGVTIVLTSSDAASQIATLRINGGADIILKAPSAAGAPYRGVAFFQVCRASAGTTLRFNGNSALSIAGAIYAANGEVEWSGNNGTTAPSCTQIVSRTITFIGDAALDDTGCQAAGARAINVNSARFPE
jgi:hypothetical protein